MKRDKNAKKLDIFKKGFKKNEVVIYAIALMLVTAGYFNYSANIDNTAIETYSEEISSNKTINEKQVSDANNVLEENINTKSNSTYSKEVSDINDNLEEINLNENNKNEVSNETAETIAKNIDSNEDRNYNDIDSKNNNEHEEKINNEQNESNQDDEDIGDAKLVDSKSVVDDSSDYFVSTKLQRDTNYADTLSIYKKILEDSSVSETQKSIAMKEITKINDTKNAISICENLLSTKGFENYVVLVNNESINVVVKTSGGLTEQKVAQINNIVSREFKCEIENIHITEK